MSENQQVLQTIEQDMWATVELMGHGLTAGRVSRPTEWGGLLRVDVPLGDTTKYATELYGMDAVFRIKFVSEEIARAHAPSDKAIESYSAPIVSREQHEAKVRAMRAENIELSSRVRELERRLTSVEALPSGEAGPGTIPFDGSDFYTAKVSDQDDDVEF